MDGLTAVKHIREEENAGKLKKNLVIALSKSSRSITQQLICSCYMYHVHLAGNARQAQIDLAKMTGMDEVVIKPYRLVRIFYKHKSSGTDKK